MCERVRERKTKTQPVTKRQKAVTKRQTDRHSGYQQQQLMKGQLEPQDFGDTERYKQIETKIERVVCDNE